MTAEDYLDGYSFGVAWAELDRANSITPHEQIKVLRDESRTDQRWARAFYLGALRGYREVVRTLRNGRWGT